MSLLCPAGRAGAEKTVTAASSGFPSVSPRGRLSSGAGLCRLRGSAASPPRASASSFPIASPEPATGAVVWEAPGRPAGYGSLIAAELGGRFQIVGHDAKTLGGWDPATGKRLWTVAPEYPDDFNVATPIVYRGMLVVSTENNGTRMFRFSKDGKIAKEPLAICADLAPDTQTPVVAGDRLLGVCQDLYCLDLADNWKVLWKGADRAFGAHASLMATDERL